MDAVLAQSHDITNAKRTVLEVKSSIDSLYHQIDPKIIARNDIGSRLRRISNQLGDIQNKVSRIQSTVESGVSSYYSTEMKASQKAKDIVIGR